MNFAEYQGASERTLQCEMTPTELLANLGFGLAGESGELLNYIKKGEFHKHGIDKEVIKEECGDILWYLSCMASYYNLSLDEIAQLNIVKLQSRYPDGFTYKDSQERKDLNGDT